MRIRLTKTVRSSNGAVYEAGRVLNARPACDGILEVYGAGWLPLSPDEWELVMDEEELMELGRNNKGGD